MRKPAIAMMLLTPLLLGACGERVEIRPAHYGKILTKDGFQPDILPPSKFRLPFCWAYCDRLITVEASDVGIEETFQLFMPRDQLNMSFDLRMTISVKNDDKSLTSVFDRLPADAHDNISVARIYQTYGQPIVREVARTVMAEYSINEVASSREAVNVRLVEAVTGAFESTPLTAKRVALADVQFPEIIVRQKEAAAERRIEIEKAEADKQIRMVELQAELEQERMRRNIRRERAEATLEENNIIAQSVTNDYLAYRRLEVLEALAGNGNAVFVPMEALGTVGLQQRIFTESTNADAASR